MDKKSEMILSWMSDEESRYIYKKRVAFQESYDYSFIQKTIDKYIPEWSEKKWLCLSDELKGKISAYRNIIVAGAGQRGRSLVVMLKKSGFNVSCMVDNGFTGELTVNGENLRVYRPEGVDVDSSCVIISLSERRIAELISDQLLALHVPDEQIIILADYVSAPMHLKEIEYFDESIIKWRNEEVFVDCGALDLETSLFFLERCKKHNVEQVRIHAFEPDKYNYDRCIDNTALFDSELAKVNVYQKGVWSENKKIGFSAIGSDSSKIVVNNESNTVEVVTLDSVIQDQVTFIKMDIEGAELEALKGAKRLIQTYHPRLALSLYHKPEDIIEIPMLVKEYNPDYKLYVRHYSNNTGELVLYAI